MASDHLIAIVDDDASVREAALSLFKSMGLEAIAFASAEEFLSSPWLERTSCLVLDVHMRGMSGPRLQGHLAANGRQIPVVFVTAYPDEASRATALRMGATVFLSKPCSEGELLDGLLWALTAGEVDDLSLK